MNQFLEQSEGDEPEISLVKSGQLCGVYIPKFGAIREQYLDLSLGLNCLYGVNGAGKSQILTCITKSLENSSELISPPRAFDSLSLSGAALVYRISSVGAYENPISRMWTGDSMGEDPGLPNAHDIIEAHGSDGMARTSEWEQGRIQNDIDYYVEHLDLIRRTINYGRLVLFPRPEQKSYQVIYAIAEDCPDEEFRALVSTFGNKMTEAVIDSKKDIFDDWDHVFSESLDAELRGSPLFNSFNVQGGLQDRFIDIFTQNNHDLDFNFPVHNFPFIPISSLGFVGKAPTVLVTEESIYDLVAVDNVTRKMLFDYATQRFDPDTYDNDDYLPVYKIPQTDEEGSSFMFKANLAASEIVEKIQSFWESFVQSPLKLSLEIGTIEGWFTHQSPRWRVGDGYVQKFGNLSFAQSRWARLAMALGIQKSKYFRRSTQSYQDHQLLIIDEPERGLHRVGESHLATGLLRYAEDNGIALIATHAPAFLNLPSANVSLVSDFKIAGLAPLDVETLEELGLHPSDLLMSYRVFWLVEGEHEIAIFETLFGDQLNRERIKLIPLRGAKSLASVADSTLLFEYTKANVVLTLDNLKSDVIRSAWSQAIMDYESGRAINKVRDDLARVVTQSSGEGRQLLEFMSNCLVNQVQKRVDMSFLSKEDIIEYFKPESFGLSGNWQALHNEYLKSDGFKNFKDYLITTYGVRISSGLLADLAADFEEIPVDFKRCVEAVLMSSLTVK